MKDKDDNSNNISEFTSIATDDLNPKYEDINEDSLCKLAFFKEFKGEYLFFKRFIQISDFDCYPQSIIDIRTYLIVLNAVQIICGLIFLTTLLFFIEELFEFLGFLLISIIGVYGIIASIQVNKGRLIFLTYSSLFGSIILSSITLLDNLMVLKNKYFSNYLADITFESLIISIYIFPLIIAFLNRKLVQELNEKINTNEVNEMTSAKNEIISLSSHYTQFHIKEFIERVEDKLCFICKKKEKNSIFLPCAHSLTCIDCVKKAYQYNISRKCRPRCPECRNEIACYYKKKSKQEDKSFSFLRFRPDISLISQVKN
jgi:hypothetical protein